MFEFYDFKEYLSSHKILFDITLNVVQKKLIDTLQFL